MCLRKDPPRRRWKNVMRFLVLGVTLLALCTACDFSLTDAQPKREESENRNAAVSMAISCVEDPPPEEESKTLTIQIGEDVLTAVLEENPAADALRALLEDGPLSLSLQDYGGFEKVGTLPQSLPQQDTQMTAGPGDIMLYQGNSIVFFYGSNSWSYTKLGEIQKVDEQELKALLDGGEKKIILSIK